MYSFAIGMTREFIVSCAWLPERKVTGPCLWLCGLCFPQGAFGPLSCGCGSCLVGQLLPALMELCTKLRKRLSCSNCLFKTCRPGADALGA